MPSFDVPAKHVRTSIGSHQFWLLHQTARNFFLDLTSFDDETENSEFLATEKNVEPIREALKALDATEENWNSYDAPTPSESAKTRAWHVLTALREEALIPERVLPSAEGGVAFVFLSSNENRGVIETLNDGEDFVLLYDRQGNSKTLEWNGEIPRALLSSLRAHLRGSRLAAS